MKEISESSLMGVIRPAIGGELGPSKTGNFPMERKKGVRKFLYAAKIEKKLNTYYREKSGRGIRINSKNACITPPLVSFLDLTIFIMFVQQKENF